MPDFHPAQPVDALPLIRETRLEMLRILENLTEDQWQHPTVCAGWSVRDVAVHLLGDDVGLLSNQRDGDGQYYQFESWQALVDFINQQNDLWVRANRRLSRRLLIDLLRSLGEQVAALFESQDPQAAAGPIGWAGSEPDPRWLHIAREFTEYWMHHQHICEALGIESLKSARYIGPLISTFTRALPQTYAAIDAPPDTVVELRFTGQGASAWHLRREPDRWRLYQSTPLKPAVTVELDTDIAWRLFTRNRPLDALRPAIHIRGEAALGEVFLTAKAYIG